MCSVAGCLKPTKALKLCAMHWWRLKYKGSLDNPTSRGNKCKSCNAIAGDSGLCLKCYCKNRNTNIKENGYKKIRKFAK